MQKKLSVVVPCFNEQEMVPIFYNQMKEIEDQLPLDFEYIFVNDGSKDETLNELKKIATHSNVNYLSLSRNFGKESALYAGLTESTGDYITVMDIDLQDPPELLIEMYDKIQNPAIDCVGTRRTTRKGEPPIRSYFAKLFYLIVNKISETEMVDGARDFRLMTREMLDAILELKEVNRFSKGIFSWVGFNTEYIEYENRERIAGETSWSFWQLFHYSLDGIINFSDAPLNIASFVGFFSCFLSLLFMFVVFFKTLILGDPTSGWPSIVCIVLFIGGIQLISLGIIGKYIGRIFLETKKRPIYIIKEKKIKEESTNDGKD